MARTQLTPHVEGSGLGAPPSIIRDQGANTVTRLGTRLSLDYYHQRLPEGVVMTYAEFRRHIEKSGNFPKATAKVSIDMIENGLYSMGGIIYPKWAKGGAVSVLKNNPRGTKERMSDRRKEYEHVQDVQGNFVVVERSRADAFRRQVALQQLALDERAAERETERIRKLKETMT
jgi:hypothetical protein